MKPITLTDQTFASEVLQTNGPVLVDFWAPWCQPCRLIAPVIDQLSAEYEGTLKVGKLNVDENPLTASKFGVRSIPTLLVFKNGKVVDLLIGAVPKHQLDIRLKRVLQAEVFQQ